MVLSTENLRALPGWWRHPGRTQEWPLPNIFQPESPGGYRYALDALILASFAACRDASRWLDLGTGCGVIARLLAEALPDSKGTAVERVAELYAYAQQNMAGCNVDLRLGDLRNMDFGLGEYDLVVCNPPFYRLGEGRVSPFLLREYGRRNYAGDIVDFAQKVRASIAPTGRFCWIYPYPEPFEAVAAQLLQAQWHFRRLDLLYTSPGKSASRACIEMVPRSSSGVSEVRHLCLWG